MEPCAQALASLCGRDIGLKHYCEFVCFTRPLVQTLCVSSRPRTLPARVLVLATVTRSVRSRHTPRYPDYFRDVQSFVRQCQRHNNGDDVTLSWPGRVSKSLEGQKQRLPSTPCAQQIRLHH